MRILLVDDDSLAREMTGAMLDWLGHEAVMAGDAVEAMALLSDDPALELVLSDMNMPLVSGIDLFRELRSQGVDLPFVLLTGDEPDIFLRQEPGLDGVALKDFGLQDCLAQVIESALDKHRRARLPT